MSPTVATALGPRRATKKTSTTANTLSSAISRTIGTARRRIARGMDPWVKSCREPRSASRIEVQKRVGSSAGAVAGGVAVAASGGEVIC